MVKPMIHVVGAVGIDMIAMRERFLEGTSNPSDIRLGLGGVGYRIFSNLDVPKRFITALATDPISRWARETLEADGFRVRTAGAGAVVLTALQQDPADLVFIASSLPDTSGLMLLDTIRGLPDPPEVIFIMMAGPMASTSSTS